MSLCFLDPDSHRVHPMDPHVFPTPGYGSSKAPSDSSQLLHLLGGEGGGREASAAWNSPAQGHLSLPSIRRARLTSLSLGFLIKKVEKTTP